MSKAEEAEALFKAGANCAQAVVGVFCGECGLDRETALKLASGFGDGTHAGSLRSGFRNVHRCQSEIREQ